MTAGHRVVVDVEDYKAVLDEMAANNGAPTLGLAPQAGAARLCPYRGV